MFTNERNRWNRFVVFVVKKEELKQKMKWWSFDEVKVVCFVESFTNNFLKESPSRIRCLHTWYASHLVVPNSIGKIVEERLKKEQERKKEDVIDKTEEERKEEDVIDKTEEGRKEEVKDDVEKTEEEKK